MSANSTVLRSFPGSQRLLLHPAAGRRSRHVCSLAGASDWRRALINRAGAALVAVTGPRAWPAAANEWAWPEAGPAALIDALCPELPGLRLIGAALPRQEDRRRLSLLCRYAGNPIVVKLGVEESAASLHTEADALRLLTTRPLPGIATPELIAHGNLALSAASPPIVFIATATVGLTGQRPAIDVALRTFESDLAQRLESLPRPAHCAVDAVPVHGDLTPWNLRRTSRGLALFDWESAGWASPGSDLATYRAACDEVRPMWRSRP